jgi:hypothetical protein
VDTPPVFTPEQLSTPPIIADPYPATSNSVIGRPFPIRCRRVASSPGSMNPCARGRS